MRMLRIANAILRGLTLGGKFFLIFVLAKVIEPAELGLYGLITATISYTLMALGFDFYTYATREMINTDRQYWTAQLRDQCVFYGITYSFILPLCLLGFCKGLLPWSLMWWFFPLLLLEHIAQEFNRLLVAMSEPLWASVVLFFRQGLWAIIAAGSMWLEEGFRSLNFVLAAWTVGAVFACLLAITRLKNLNRSGITNSINWEWIRRGARIALPFVLATLSLRALYTVDRYMIEALNGLAVTGAYVLYFGIANVILTFVDATVITFLYPALIAAAGKHDSVVFNDLMAKLTRQTLLITLGLSLFVIVMTKPIVFWLDKPGYSEYYSMLYWTVLGSALFCVSLVPHYGLYARKMDKQIILSHIIMLPIFFIAVWMTQGLLAESAVPASMALSFLFLLVAKAAFFLREPQLLRSHN
jgi:O-antigen/teichoic acid export membrane protein